MVVINYTAFQQALELLYEDTVSAYVTVSTQDPKTKVMKTRKELILKDAPCLLSFNSETHTNSEIGYINIKRQDVITTPPDVVIPPGSEVHVTRKMGHVYKYGFSDIASIHQSHRRYALSKEGVD